MGLVVRLSATPRLGWGANKRAISGPFQKGKDEIAIQDLNEHVNHIVLQILYIKEVLETY